MDIICVGELLIDFLPMQSGVSFEEVREFRRVPGGAPANVAVGAAKLGLKAAFAGRVGDDRFGKYLASVLKKNRVDISQLQYDKNARTTLAFISLPTPNTREFQFYRNPGADMNLDWRDFDNSFIQEAGILHFGSITLIEEPGRTSTYEAVGTARDAGAVISYDPNWRPTLWPSEKRAKEIITAAVPLSHVIKVSHEELELISGTSDLEKGSNIILDMGPKICLVTLGDKGCFYAAGDFSGHIPSFKVNTVDATGCGDSFVSGVLYGINDKGLEEISQKEDSLQEILKYASAAAALTATQKGVIPSLPLKDEVDKYTQRRNNKYYSY
jgi:fructokinase